MGGGLLETNNQLERFTKNKKNKKIIYSIIGILLIIGSITLFKTYAFFEEKQEFNVIKGQVPSHWYDMNLLSVKVEGSEVESIPERGLYKTNVECTNGYGEWDYNSWSLKLTDLKENTKCNIEFTKNLSTEEYNKYLEAGIALRRNTYRGKDITEYYNNGSLYEMISKGTFDDIYVGDYINANGIKWLIADIDNYLYTGNPLLTKHHVTIIPAKPLANDKMNETRTVEDGYFGSKMYSETLQSLLNIETGIIGKTFGSHLVEYVNVRSNSVNGEGLVAGVSEDFGKIDLMSEVNVYGNRLYASTINDMIYDYNQYAIFHLNPKFINSNGNETFSYWLKDVANNECFVSVLQSGRSWNWTPADDVQGIRPRFLID